MTVLHQSWRKIGTLTANLKHALAVTLGSSWLTVTCAERETDSGCWEEPMDGETSTRQNFLSRLLLIPFPVIGLSIKALIIMLPTILPLISKLLHVKGLDRPINCQIYLSDKYLLTVFPKKKLQYDVILQLHLRKT